MKKQIKVWMAGVMLGLLASCSTITEDLPLCTHQLTFRYDYNMKFVDAFPVAVKKVDVFVFDANDRFVTHFSEEREAFGPNYRMPLSLPEGDYHLVTWAGRYPRSYDFEKELIPGQSTPKDVYTRIRCNETGIVKNELDALWHGETRITLTEDKNQTATISLTKDTNKFRIVVQGPTGWKGDELQFSITDENGLLGGDNSLLPDTPLEYRPYFQQMVEIDGEIHSSTTPLPNTLEAGKLKSVVAELNTSRLMESKHPRLRILQSDGTKVVDIDLIQYLLLTKMEGHHMSAQEYLDRQDEYAMIFFLSQDLLGQYLVVKVKVNGWTIRLQSGEF